MRVAITRQVSPAIHRCELTHVRREPIDLGLARQQHHRYVECLAALGCRTVSLPEEPYLPDSVFVEDTAVVLDEIAVLARPGAESRRSETTSVKEALTPYRTVIEIDPPGTLDGGDVLTVGKEIFVGLSDRTNRAGFMQLREIAGALGYRVRGVGVRGCLHLKSAVTCVAEDTILVNGDLVDVARFGPLRRVETAPSEPGGANGLQVGGSVIYPSGFPRTRRRLEEVGIAVRTVEISELAKAEGAVTCCSLVFEASGPARPRARMR